MMKFFELFYLTFLAIKVKIHVLIMYFFDRKKYYKNASFKVFDKAFHKAYRFKNPYIICKKHMQSRGAKNTDVYGETPLSVYEKIIEITDLKKLDYFIELGCGRGRGLFFTHYFSGCHCLGIEFVDTFCVIADKLILKFHAHEISVKKRNFFRCDLSSADVIYLCSTLLTDNEINHLSALLSKCKKTVKIVTTSLPLSDYTDDFKTIKEFEARFLWGKTTVFVNILA